jgi:hypothetical protein
MMFGAALTIRGAKIKGPGELRGVFMYVLKKFHMKPDNFWVALLCTNCQKILLLGFKNKEAEFRNKQKNHVTDLKLAYKLRKLFLFFWGIVVTLKSEQFNPKLLLGHS